MGTAYDDYINKQRPTSSQIHTDKEGNKTKYDATNYVYTVNELSNPESGYNLTKKTVYADPSKTTKISESTYKVVPDENEKSISVSASRVSTNPNTNRYVASRQTEQSQDRFISNYNIVLDQEKEQSISLREKYKRENEKTFENNNQRNTTVENLKTKSIKESYNNYFSTKEKRQKTADGFIEFGKEYLKGLKRGSKNVLAGTQSTFKTVLDYPIEKTKQGKEYGFKQEFQKNFKSNLVNIYGAGKNINNEQDKKEIYQDVNNALSKQGLQESKNFISTVGYTTVAGKVATLGKGAAALVGLVDFGFAAPTFATTITNPTKQNIYTAGLELIDIGVDFVPAVALKGYNAIFPKTTYEFKTEGYLDQNTKVSKDTFLGNINSETLVQIGKSQEKIKFEPYLEETVIVEKSRSFDDVTNNYGATPDFTDNFNTETTETKTTRKYPKQNKINVIGELTPTGVKSYRTLNPQINAMFNSKKANTDVAGINQGFTSNTQTSNTQTKTNPTLFANSINYQTSSINGKIDIDTYNVVNKDNLINIKDGSTPSVNYDSLINKKTTSQNIPKTNYNLIANNNFISRSNTNNNAKSNINSIFNTNANTNVDTKANTNIDYTANVNANVDTKANTNIDYTTNVNTDVAVNPPFNFNIPSQIARQKKTRSVEGYNVFVKIKNKFVKVNTKAYDKQSAINFGAFKVGTSSAASFKIMNSNSYGAQSFNSFKFDSDKFTKSKKDKKVFVEKNKYRINTAGELKEITFKGINTKKYKGVF